MAKQNNDVINRFKKTLGYTPHGNNKKFKELLNYFNIKKFKNKTEKKNFLKNVMDKKIIYKGSINITVLIHYADQGGIKEGANDGKKYIVGKGEYVRGYDLELEDITLKIKVYREFHTIPFSQEMTYLESLNINTKKIIDDLLEKIFNRAYVYKVELERENNNILRVPDKNINLKDIRMKLSDNLNIDTFENQLWDTHKNKCVFDYIIYTYKDIKGFKKICNYESLNNIFNDGDSLSEGVSSNGIYNFCVYSKIPLHGLDDELQRFIHYVPINRHRDAPPMVYRLSNNHFYPMPKNKIKSVITFNQIIDCNSKDLTFKLINEKKEENFKECIYLKNKDPILEISKIINNEKIIPDKNIYCLDGSISSFEYNNKKYCMNDNNELCKEICDKMNIIYNGQGLACILKNIIDSCGGIKSSVYNKHTYDILLKAKSKRTHYGLIDESCKKLMKYGYSRDINKCYSSVMYNPLSEWLRLGFNDIWELYDGKLKLGLYYVETNDNTLFKKSDVYSNTIIEKAIKENINFVIKYQLIPSYKEDKNILKNIIDKILFYCDNDSNKYKLLNNMISGLLAKTKISFCKYKINNDLNQIFSFINKYPDLNLNIKKIPDTDYYLYGCEKITDNIDNNLAMYIQIIDQSNIKLYDMIKKMNGRLICRNIDCAVVVEQNDKNINSNKWGDNNICITPQIEKVEEIEDKKYNFNIDEWKDYNIRDSDEWEKIKDIYINKGGLLLTASAGCGKTYVAKQLINNLDKYVILSPTNKASLNLNGYTIHKYLNLDGKGNVSTKKLNFIKRNIDYIIIDEISMISSKLWDILSFVKRACDVKFLLLGDEKQLPPVNDEYENYFNHPAIKYICNNNRNILNVVKRYDIKLKEALDNIDNINIDNFYSNEETLINMCYTNKTRKIINKRLNDKYKNNESLYIKYNDDDVNSQEYYLYENLPLMAIKTDNKHKEYYNNEAFKVIDINDNDVILKSDDREDHIISFNIDELYKTFYINYCSTIHKYQGSTIKEKYKIWDWNSPLMSKKAKYTALSRAVSIDNVFIER